MKKYLCYFSVILLLGIGTLPVISDINSYNVHEGDKSGNSIKINSDEKILFIVDFSNSMNDYLGSRKKIDVAISSLSTIAGKLNPSTKTGLRVYGHKHGFNPFLGCTATNLISPIMPNNTRNIYAQLSQISPNGWTPITRSLKQAVNNDFANIDGDKRIILLTDGGENCDESPCEYAIQLVQTRDDIKIDVIALAINDPIAEEHLKCTALATSGKTYHANDAAALENVLGEILNVTTDVQGTIIKK